MKHFILFSFIVSLTLLFLITYSKKHAEKIAIKDNVSGSLYSLKDYPTGYALQSVSQFISKVGYTSTDNKSQDNKTITKKINKKSDNKSIAPDNQNNDKLSDEIKKSAMKVYNGFKDLVDNGFVKSSEDNDTESLDNLIKAIQETVTKVTTDFKTLLSDNKTIKNSNLKGSDNITK